MPIVKRAFDIALALLLAVPLLPVVAAVATLILLRDGRPVFYVSERMKTVDQGFRLWKFRTMQVASDDAMASGGHKSARITATGRFLRRARLDEVPQLWNILRGDMSFVGPRPPLRRYVEMFPDLYGRVLQSRPGVTGLATLLYHREEDRILAASQSAAETERLYTGRCVPRKAALDLLYQRNRNLCVDLRIILATVVRSISPVARRNPERRR